MKKGDYIKAIQILDGREGPKPTKIEIPIAKERKMPLGLVQAYLRAKLEGWLLDEYDLRRFVKKSSQIWQVSTKQVEQ
jgi:hypothetical protein